MDSTSRPDMCMRARKIANTALTNRYHLRPCNDPRHFLDKAHLRTTADSRLTKTTSCTSASPKINRLTYPDGLLLTGTSLRTYNACTTAW